MTTKNPTRREMVLKSLKAARRGKFAIDGKAVKTPGGWLTREQINSVGGTDGMRRLRELRAEGVSIEKRRVAGSTRHFEYRLGK